MSTAGEVIETEQEPATGSALTAVELAQAAQSACSDIGHYLLNCACLGLLWLDQEARMVGLVEPQFPEGARLAVTPHPA
ncbi:hypothetical protein [Streptomyces sp. H39-S7]|uniref:hypothetical protein n=1 Tax=Streptomyces sp. H39-S7 TaxID=3004357 RepID=UPI0022B00A94|nr:hypothetical protein [Streptomyces sp. H39-S7]MCZ4125433.1 hypothetical protein [Streptomyces sp. H39-S7]